MMSEGKFKKLLMWAFLTAVVIFITVAAMNIAVMVSAEKHIYSPKHSEKLSSGEFDCIVVLGAGLRPDGTPSHMLRDRLDTAIQLYNDGLCNKLLMSGDHGTQSYDEVNTMKAYALEKGIPEENIYLDHAGFSTYETVYRAKEIFCVESCIIVTQKYHLYRAVYTARALGISAEGVNSDPFRYSGQIKRDLREIVARCKDFIICIFKPKPTYLGEKIDIQTSFATETYG